MGGSAGFPTTPVDVPDATFRDMVDAHMAHTSRLVDARHNIGEPLPAAELARHALAALAGQHAVAERILYTRWCNARDVLTYGATVEDAAAAMGLDVDEVVFGLTRWAEGQHHENLISRAQLDEVLALVEGPEVTR